MPSIRHPQSLCRIGLARCDITPPADVYHRMWGAATHDRATGVHQPLTATALVFQPADASAERVLIAVDHVLLWAREMNDLLSAISSDTGLSQEQIAVTFSHTHAAGLMGLERVELPGGDLIPAYLRSLASQLAKIVGQARGKVEPVSITYGAGRCALAAHRDFWDEESGQFVCGFNPDGPADDAVLIARIDDAMGKPLASIVNYACHPTTLAWDNTLISPDYPGAMRQLVEEATGVPCVFLQGASGDLGPREGFVGDLDIAERNGRELGYAVLSTWESLPPPLTKFTYTGPVVSGATIGTWRHEALDADEALSLQQWRLRRWTVDLPYRADLPTIEATQAEMESWQQREQAAHRDGNSETARNCRAMAERSRRLLAKLQVLPSGPTFPLPVTAWQMGDAIWVAVEGEPYQWLQRKLRERFPQHSIIVMTLTNGSRPSYLPTEETYGKGIYQETIAFLEKGCLEHLVEAIVEQIAEWSRP